MKTSRLGRTAGALAAAGLLLGLAAPSPQGVGVGEEVAHTFRTAPLNAMGVTSLADLRGKPVVVEFWGTR
jgi:hypothetical protein